MGRYLTRLTTTFHSGNPAVVEFNNDFMEEVVDEIRTLLYDKYDIVMDKAYISQVWRAE